MIVAAGFLQCAEVAESTWGPELSGPFVTTLAAEAGRLHRAAAYGPAPVRNLPVVHSVGLAGEIVFLSAQRLAALTSGTLERTDLGEHLRVLPMAQLVQPRLHPGLERRFVPPLTGPSQLPQVLGTVPEIQDLDGLLPAVRGQVPEPKGCHRPPPPVPGLAPGRRATPPNAAVGPIPKARLASAPTPSG